MNGSGRSRGSGIDSVSGCAVAVAVVVAEAVAEAVAEEVVEGVEAVVV